MPDTKRRAAQSTYQDLLPQLTLREKASLLSGANFWESRSVDRLGIPSVFFADGPHGIRKQVQGSDHVGLAPSLPSTCFPPAAALGGVWDPDLLKRIGAALGTEARAQGVHVLLGPGINIKRSPLCGRNFEYFSEDPLISGTLGAAYVEGLQSQGVGAALKHFAVNNQETDRLRVSAEVDTRTFREIYASAFHRVVREAHPWVVMCSYNRINGVYAHQDRTLLTELLRDEWGFDGMVVSDWGAVDERVPAVAAGLDLEMPGSGGVGESKILAAVQTGALSEAELDTAVANVLALLDRTTGHDPASGFDAETHHALAREAASRAIVLLSNPLGVLPLDPASNGRIAVIGEFARTPRYQGAGSSLIVPTRIDDALTAIQEIAGEDRVQFAPGFTLEGAADEALSRDAVSAARAAEVAIVFLGLPDGVESEGFDRTDIELPAAQTDLLEMLLATETPVVVVLSHGGVVRVSDWADRAAAILDGGLLGQAGGTATADALFGFISPSGRLAETIPLRLKDTPSYLNFPGEHGQVRYGEGIYVGYRGYDALDTKVSFPFGHGLSYTSFDYSNLRVESDSTGLDVQVTVTNTGSREGREIVQVYVGNPDSSINRAPRELKAFAAIDLAAGVSGQVALRINRTDLAYYHAGAECWTVEGGSYTVEVGASSRDIRLIGTVSVDSDPLSVPLTLQSSLAEWLDRPDTASIIHSAAVAAGPAGALFTDPTALQMIGSMPLKRVADFPASPLTGYVLHNLLALGS